MELKVYKNKKEKIYRADSAELTWGVIEDLAQAVDLDKLKTGSDAEIISAAMGLMVRSTGTVRDLIKRIFDGITDEEIRTAAVADIAAVIADAVRYTINEISRHIRSKN